MSSESDVRRRLDIERRDWLRKHGRRIVDQGDGRFRWVLESRKSDVDEKLEELEEWASGFGLDRCNCF